MSTSGRLSSASQNNRKGVKRCKGRDVDSISYQDDRGHWGSRAEFVLSCLGYSVGLGNLWRFPYLAYENGGGAFLVPYLLLLLAVGRPIYLMQVCLGQYSQLGPMHTYRRATPLMAGLGYAQVLKSTLSSTSYMVIISYSLHYLFTSLAYIGTTLPWATCNSFEPDDNCYIVGEETPCSRLNLTGSTEDVTCTTADETAAARYWRKDVIDLDPVGMEVFGQLGSIQMSLVMCLLVGWVITGLCMMNGIKTSGKVVYFTATFPFLTMIVLMVAGLQLPGANKGLYYLFVPEWSALLDVHVWRVALEQVIYSLSIGGGGLITFGSYNDFNSKVHIDVMILAALDLIASLLCSITIFSVLGAMAEELGYEDIGQVVASGPGLAFVAYPEAITRTLPLPHFWAFLFFFMVFTLGLDSMFGSLENLLTSIFDEYPNTRNKKPLLVFIICIVLFCCGIPYCTQKGQYLFYLLDVYLTGVGGLLFTFLACVSVHWVYGVNKFSDNLHFMLNYTPSWLLKGTWAIIAPFTLLALFVGSLIRWKYPVYADKVLYPSWAHTIGGALPVLVMAPVLIMALMHIMDKIWAGKWRLILEPSSLWGPGCPVARQRLREVNRLKREDTGKKMHFGNANMAFDSTTF